MRRSGGLRRSLGLAWQIICLAGSLGPLGRHLGPIGPWANLALLGARRASGLSWALFEALLVLYGPAPHPPLRAPNGGRNLFHSRVTLEQNTQQPPRSGPGKTSRKPNEPLFEP